MLHPVIISYFQFLYAIQLRIEHLIFNLHDVMRQWAELKLHEAQRLFFSVIREDSMQLGEIRGLERLFIDTFGHDIRQPSP